ncbi:hypothetical protein ILYODFUR_009213 [Ilyodon furcidens]|uniref:Methyltransferase domain-containing protein n=1 Tax=Ilyodon furcidens TaxID=33524 RepID=A0ABV0V4I0_9TELE
MVTCCFIQSSLQERKMSNIRAIRKMQQLNNLVAMVTELARPGDTVVDFCSGTGHVGIVLAHTLPDCQIILIENKEESLVRAQRRSSELDLKNIGFLQANLDYFNRPFQIGTNGLFSTASFNQHLYKIFCICF